jgi:EmrB/QacA subfamily drug resistance transporter
MTTPARSEGFDPALRRLAVVVILGAVMTILDTTIVNVAINTLGHDFKTSLSTIQWVLTGYMLALSMSIPLTGWAVDRFGAKTMWLVSLLLFISGSVLCGVAWNIGSLVGFRVIQGLGAGMIMPIGQSMLAREAGPQRMGRVMSVIAVPAMLAPVLGPTIGGLILDNLSWRWMFYVNVPFCVVALVAAVKLLPADGERNREARLDVLGLLMLSPGLAALVYALAEAGGGTSLSSPKVLVSGIGGLALVTGFVLHAIRKGEKALVDVRLYRNRTFSAANSALFVYVGALFGVMALLPLYFQVVRGYTPLRSGLLVAPMGLGAMVAMPIAGRLSDKMGSRPLAFCGLPIMLLGVLGYTQLHVNTPIPLLMALLFVIGVGQGTMMPALMGGSYQTLERKDIASATTASNVGMRIGGSFGVAILTVLLQHYFQNLDPGSGGSFAAARSHGDFVHLAHAFRNTFWWTLGIAAFSLIPIAFIGRKVAPPAAPAERVEAPQDIPAAPVEI